MLLLFVKIKVYICLIKQNKHSHILPNLGGLVKVSFECLVVTYNFNKTSVKKIENFSHNINFEYLKTLNLN